MGKLDSIVSGWKIYTYIVCIGITRKLAAWEKFYFEIDDMNFLLHCFD